MTVPVIAEQLATYLQTAGYGTVATDIFFDYQPDIDVDTITVYDLGGDRMSTLAPDLWREVYVQVRCKTHADGYERIWQLLNLLLYPVGGEIVIGADKYTAQFYEIPTITDRDKTNRYLFGFTVIVQKSITIQDPWVDAIVDWTQDLLGPDWTIYKGIAGGKYPHVVWQIGNFNIEDHGRAMFRVSKTLVATVAANNPNDQIYGATKLVEGLGGAIKIPLDTVNRRYLTVESVSSSIKPDDMRIATVEVVLSRLTNRPTADAPVITSVTITTANLN